MNFDQLLTKYSSSTFLNKMQTLNNSIHCQGNTSHLKQVNLVNKAESNQMLIDLFESDHNQKDKNNEPDLSVSYIYRDHNQNDNDFNLNESVFEDDLLKGFEIFEHSKNSTINKKKSSYKHYKLSEYFKWPTFDNFVTKQDKFINFALQPVGPFQELSKIENLPLKPSNKCNTQFNLESILKIPAKYRPLFSKFGQFNPVQSKVFNSVFYTENSLVVCSPTGSGKTVIFELAIVRLLLEQDLNQNIVNQEKFNFKIIFMAPLKALCHERFQDWKIKFEPYELSCLEVTGDSDEEQIKNLKNVSIIFTTPEKWDSLTRKWFDLKYIINQIRLILIDEIHILNDESRGPIVEAVVSRMKIFEKYNEQTNFRFIALSATAPNSEDVAVWFSKKNMIGINFNLPEEYRTVKLNKMVFGFDCPDSFSDFKFDINLNYKLKNIIFKYSENKPSLIFVSTRKSTLMTAEALFKETAYFWNNNHSNQLQIIASKINDTKLRNYVLKGIAFHHAGLNFSDRQLIEKSFLNGYIPVLISTSTLSMGINLPAHLVIIKGTFHYLNGICVEYTSTELLQMIGRAGRPQFDESATAIIMTKTKLKAKYEKILSGSEVLESNLHKHLAEHLNADIVLKTITNTLVAMDWIRSTFFYIRICKNQTYYGLNATWDRQKIEEKIQDMCIKELHALKKLEMIKMDLNENYIFSTEIGRLMAHYYTSLETMKKFINLKGNETLENLIELISSCEEVQKEVCFRISERKSLNMLNEKGKNEKHRIVRFPLKKKINNCSMKANCLIQATLGCLPIFESSLTQDATKIMKIGQRISKCLAEVILIKKKNFSLTLNVVLLAKCFRAQLWENSKYVSRQLNKIGLILSTALVNGGLTSLESLENADSRIIEMFANRNPPFGKQIKDAIKCLPKYRISLNESEEKNDEKRCEKIIKLKINITLINYQIMKEKNSFYHSSVLIVGDKSDELIFFQKINQNHFFKNNGIWSKEILLVDEKKREKILVYLISEQLVGVDVALEYDLLIKKNSKVLKEISTNSALLLFNSKKLKPS